MDRSLLLIDNTLDARSPLAVQLGLTNVLDFMVQGSRYGDVLENALGTVTDHFEVHVVDWSVYTLTVGQFLDSLRSLVPHYRGFKNVMVFAACNHFTDSSELLHVIRKSHFADEPLRMGLDPDCFCLPVSYLDQFSDRSRPLKFLQTEARWDIRGEVINLNLGTNLFKVWQLQTKERSFNRLERQGPYLVKSGSRPEKLKSESHFLSHLPDVVSAYFPRTLAEHQGSYRVEYLPCLDASRLFIHGKLPLQCIQGLMDQLQEYLNACPKKHVTSQVGLMKAREFLIDKVNERVRAFLASPQYDEHKSYYELLFPGGVSQFASKLTAALEGMLQKLKLDEVVFSHGDLCLSNILYDPSTGLMKLIDPRGALNEDEFYLPRIYDLAKLSHSFLGRYEFIKNNLAQLVAGHDLRMKLDFRAPEDFLRQCEDVFRRFLAKNDADEKQVRLVEASLFLSMLPLHADTPDHQVMFFHQAVCIFRDVNS